MNYIVNVLDKNLENEYNIFWEKLSFEEECVLAYHHLSYRNILKECLGKNVEDRYRVVIDIKNKCIVAVFPFFIIQ